MSDKTLFNQDLTLNSLTVNNSIDQNASGYVATSTTINPDKITSPQLAVDLLGIFSDTSPNPPVLSTVNNNLLLNLYGNANMQVAGTGGVVASAFTAGNTVTIQNGTGSPNDVVLSCPQNNVLNVAGSVITSAVEILSSTGNVNLTAPTASTLQVGGNVQAEGLAGTALILQNGVNSTTLSQSSTANNTLVLAGDLNVNGDITTPLTSAGSVSSFLYKGGIIAANWVPATPIICAPGLYTGTTFTIPNVPTNINYANCVYSFQCQALNLQGGCGGVTFPSYTTSLSGSTLTIVLYINNSGPAGATINYIGVIIINPGYTAIAP
jgi:hypothetical protein